MTTITHLQLFRATWDDCGIEYHEMKNVEGWSYLAKVDKNEIKNKTLYIPNYGTVELKSHEQLTGKDFVEFCPDGSFGSSYFKID